MEYVEFISHSRLHYYQEGLSLLMPGPGIRVSLSGNQMCTTFIIPRLIPPTKTEGYRIGCVHSIHLSIIFVISQYLSILVINDKYNGLSISYKFSQN